MAIANSIQAEVNNAIRQLRKVSARARTEGRSALRKGARPLVIAAKSKAPVSDEPHYRYLNGEIVATYHPGNLRRSIRALIFSKSDAVFVGPKIDKSGSGGVFKGARTDGYYAHMVEFGTAYQRPQPFMRPAAQEAGREALQIAVRELKAQVDKYANSISV